jgi:hypothetical protein
MTTCFFCVIISQSEYSSLSQQCVMSVPVKTARFLSQNWVSELVWDSEGDEAGATSGSISEDEGGFEDEPGVSHMQPDRPTSSDQESNSLFLSSASDEVEVIQNGPGQQVQTPSTSQWTRPSGHKSSVVYTFTRDPTGKTDSEATHTNDISSPLSVFLLYVVEIITPLVVKTNGYYHEHLDRLDKGPSSLSDANKAEMLVFFAVAIQKGQCLQDKLTDYWAMTNQFHTHFYGSAMKRDRYLHILYFLCYTDNKNEPDIMDKNSDRLREM